MPNPTYKRPESVLVVIYSTDGHVLMLRRRRPHDFWQSVTGSLEWGETAQQAARRELHEETGLTGEPEPTGVVNRFTILPAWRHRYAPDVEANVEKVFRYALPEPRPVILNPEEHAEFCWLPAAEAAALATSYTNRAAIEALFGR